jgi:hypothetical protein
LNKRSISARAKWQVIQKHVVTEQGRRRDEIVSELQFRQVASRNEAGSEEVLTCHMTLVQDTIGNLFAQRTAILGGGPGIPGSEGAAS